jgi:DNA repair protein RecO
MVVTTQAIVLRSRKQGDTSKIVTLYTRQFGKLNVIAKGAREFKSKFGGALEAFSLSDIVFYYKKDTGGLYLISKAETVTSHSGILKSLERIETASQIVELVSRTMHDEEENPRLFTLLSETLNALSAGSPESLNALLLYFYLRFIEISGFQFSLNGEVSAPAPHTHLCFKIKTGEIAELMRDAGGDLHSSVSNDHIPIHPESLAVLRYLEDATVEKAKSLRMSARAFGNLSEIFSAFFSEHFANLNNRSLKSTGALTRK